MKYQYEIRQTPAVDGSKVLPFDRLNAELFYPTREENVATNEMVKVMACEVAECMLDELRDPKKANQIIFHRPEVNSAGARQQRMNIMPAWKKWQQTIQQRVHLRH